MRGEEHAGADRGPRSCAVAARLDSWMRIQAVDLHVCASIAGSSLRCTRQKRGTLFSCDEGMMRAAHGASLIIGCYRCIAQHSTYAPSARMLCAVNMLCCVSTGARCWRTAQGAIRRCHPSAMLRHCSPHALHPHITSACIRRIYTTMHYFALADH